MSNKNDPPSPSPAEPNGRSRKGRFAPGNSFGKGNPHAKRVGELRTILLASVKNENFKAIAETLINLAKSGDLTAVKELFQRTLGPAVELDLIERLEALETRIAEITERQGAA